MKKLWCVVTALLLALCGCTREPATSYWEPERPQIAPLLREETCSVPETVRAVWIPVMHYAAWMTGRTEAQFRQTVREVFTNCAALGLNTVFLHVRAYADAYYASSLFPPGAYLSGDYDPLDVMTEEAHAAGLSVHAWVNPLRGPTAEVLAQTDMRYPLRQWLEDDTKNGTCIVPVDGRYWLNPAYPEVRELVADGVREILEQYDVEGIHIDDYFYPTQSPTFDAAAFADSGKDDLGDFRRENCSALVQALFETVKVHDPACIFSISPQGNLHADYEEQYADAARWAGETGFCDWLIPQLYYGYANAVCPFAETLAQWKDAAGSAQLIIGLAAYKVGAEDPWAGSGADEWQTAPTVLSAQTAQVLGDGLGVAFYSYEALFSEDAAAERERIAALLQP